ncbi:hypothetical protein [Polaromonas naphthalenivorans]|uniref:hypothetical protein n=1 Tax=Polaromonas naphthalenivorans TaxID=216465 RepID=UPI0012ED28DC|nr:hypothetical protein [Polaromonas naphthalenivorans]
MAEAYQKVFFQSILFGKYFCNNADAPHGAGSKDVQMTDEKKPPHGAGRDASDADASGLLKKRRMHGFTQFLGQKL